MVKKKTKNKENIKVKKQKEDKLALGSNACGIECMAKSLEKAEENLEKIEEIKEDNSIESAGISIKASKVIGQIKKGDKIKVDGKEYEVDAHYVLIEHGTTNEMAIELFDSKTDKDYQLRYFSDQVETTLEFYELQEIIYVRKQVSSIEW